MKVGIAYRNRNDPYRAGREIAAEAMEKGALSRPDIALAFAGGKLDHQRFLEGFRSVIGPKVPIVGGSAIGIITNHELSYNEYPAGAAVLDLGRGQCRVASCGGLDADEESAGKRLGKKLSLGPSDQFILIFYDSIKKPPQGGHPPVMNASRPLIKGLEENMEHEVPVLGGGVIGDYSFNPPIQFVGSGVNTQSVVAIAFSGPMESCHRIMHGCTPIDGIYHTITRKEGSIIYEIDGRPAVYVIDEIYQSPDWRDKTPVELLTIGLNCGEKYGPPEEEKYINRLITGVLPGDKGICLFEPDLEEGTEIQFMLRNVSRMISSAETNSRELFDQVESSGRKPGFSFYIDCAGRAGGYSHIFVEEAAKVQDACNEQNVPLFGFYSGVEVAPILGKSRGLDWTGVMIAFTEEIQDA